MKKKLLMILTVCIFVLLFVSVFAISVSAEEYSGSCGADGDNVKWHLDTETGILTISGEGEMADFEWKSAPWYSYKNDIKTVIIGNGVINIGEYAFHDCESMTSVELPESVNSLDDRAFYCCKELVTIDLPTTLTNIGYAAFYGCESLESIEIPTTVKELNNDVFWECKSLSEIKIPNSIKSIGSYAFCGCEGLSEVEIPDSVESIGEAAFRNCKNLTSVTIGKSVTSIAYSAFSYGCDSLASIVVVSGNEVYHSSGNCVIETAAKTVAFGCKNSVIPNDGSVTVIGDRSFYDCKNLVSIVLPDYVTVIEFEAFYGCIGLVSIEMSKNLTMISGSAFEGCSSLESIDIPASVTSIGAGAFQDCENLNSVYITDIEAWLNISYGSSNFEAPSDCHPNYYGTLYLLDSNGEEVTDVVIPETITSIGAYTFAGFEGLTSISIPDSVTSIGDSSFTRCKNLTNISIPDSVVSIGRFAFYESGYYNEESNWENGALYISDNLIEVRSSLSGDCKVKEGTKVIADYAFYNCNRITSIEIPDSVVNTGKYSFRYISYYNEESNWEDGSLYINNHLIAVKSSVVGNYTVRENTKTIANEAFSGCSKLTGVEIPNSVVNIGERAFFGCSGLTEMVIPNSVTSSIGDFTFYSCSKLETVTIGSSVTEIGNSAFENCKLTSINIPCSVKRIGEGAFSFCANLASANYFGEEGDLTIKDENNYLTDVLVYTNEHNYPEGKDRCASCGKYRDGIGALHGYSISLEGDILVNFYFDISADTLADSEAYVLLTYPGGSTKQLSFADLRTKISSLSGDTYYIVTANVAAKDYEKAVTAQIFLGDGTEGILYSRSVKEYADTILESPEGKYSEELAKLVNSMLEYCSEAKNYFDEAEATEDVAPEITSDALADSKAEISGSEEGISYYGSSLILESETTVRHYFTVMGDISEYSFCFGEETLTPTEESEGLWRVDIANIPARKLDEVYTVTVGGITVKYSAMSYVCEILSKENGTALCNVVKRLCLYNAAANAYFENIEVE